MSLPVARSLHSTATVYLHSKEGVTQGYPLAIIAYDIGFLPLIQDIQDKNPCVNQPWYANEAEPGGNFKQILAHLRDLHAWGAPWCNFPEITKSILVIAPHNVAKVEELFRGMGMKIVTGRCYLGVFIGNREAEKTWLAEKMQGLVE